ncbi:unnamed protein product [Gordionus sp. m RMFG-2023]|uniref:probable ATP-dependent RNA helicase ddx42 n=1 Tax=Gordionus sp. m RMFG-2023 TaxID=3053472 RepID=UPI0030E46BFF
MAYQIVDVIDISKGKVEDLNQITAKSLLKFVLNFNGSTAYAIEQEPIAPKNANSLSLKGQTIIIQLDKIKSFNGILFLTQSNCKIMYNPQLNKDIKVFNDKADNQILKDFEKGGLSYYNSSGHNLKPPPFIPFDNSITGSNANNLMIYPQTNLNKSYHSTESLNKSNRFDQNNKAESFFNNTQKFNNPHKKDRFDDKNSNFQKDKKIYKPDNLANNSNYTSKNNNTRPRNYPPPSNISSNNFSGNYMNAFPPINNNNFPPLNLQNFPPPNNMHNFPPPNSISNFPPPGMQNPYNSNIYPANNMFNMPNPYMNQNLPLNFNPFNAQNNYQYR